MEIAKIRLVKKKTDLDIAMSVAVQVSSWNSIFHVKISGKYSTEIVWPIVRSVKS